MGGTQAKVARQISTDWHAHCEDSLAEQKALAMSDQIIGSVSAVPLPDVLAALRDASRKTGSDFEYLLTTAQRESSLNSAAKSKASSALGLFQFIDQTWLGLIKRFGGRHGLGAFAAEIQQGESGGYSVAAAETKSAILALRQDPAVSALMAGEAANETKESLQCALGRQVCTGELYAAHFLGATRARQLIALKQAEPDTRADLHFPQAAKANRSVFYNADGSAKTVGEVYAWVVGDSALSTPTTPKTQLASAIVPSPTIDKIAPPQWHRPQSIGNWSSANRAPSFFSSPSGVSTPAAMPRSALLLSPSILELLSSLGSSSTS